MEKVTTTFRISVEMRERLRKATYLCKKSMGAIIRSAISKELDRIENKKN